jgi:glutamate-1-semialdehyde aminotransferase
MGSTFWDVDGNKYIDFTNALASVTLGYQDIDVDTAVREQMKSGVTFSLPHKLEIEVADLLVQNIPCAQKVRFAKNGTDATSAAVRVARAYTKRDRVAVCGYHGWQDWYIGSTSRDLGVPNAVKGLTHPFVYNDASSLETLLVSYPDQFAAIILEPMNVTYPKARFLEDVRELADHHGAILIFDETVTGFRFSLGGAQELFGVIPDLATFGKGLANGYPLSALVGYDKYMEQVEHIFFSGTFGGESLSLAAAKAVISKLESHKVLEHIYEIGQALLIHISSSILKYDLSQYLSVSGHPTWTFLHFHGSSSFTLWDLKTLYLQEMFKRGIFTIGVHNLSYAHSMSDIKLFSEEFDSVCSLLKRCIQDSSIQQSLQCSPLKPLFQVR